jgi:hypothetical protein
MMRSRTCYLIEENKFKDHHQQMTMIGEDKTVNVDEHDEEDGCDCNGASIDP